VRLQASFGKGGDVPPLDRQQRLAVARDEGAGGPLALPGPSHGDRSRLRQVDVDGKLRLGTPRARGRQPVRAREVVAHLEVAGIGRERRAPAVAPEHLAPARARQPGVGLAPREQVNRGVRADGVGTEGAGIAALVRRPPRRDPQVGRGRRSPAKRTAGLEQEEVVVADAFAGGRRDARVAVARRPARRPAPAPRPARARGRERRARRGEAAVLDGNAGPRRAAAARHHLHRPADRVAAEQRALGTADHLDPLDVGRRERGEVEAAAERVHLDPVHQHQREVGVAAAREDRRHASPAAVARDREPLHPAQRVGDRLRLARLHLLARDHRHGGGCSRQRQLDLGSRHDHRLGDRGQPQRQPQLGHPARPDLERHRAGRKPRRGGAQFVPPWPDAGESEPPRLVGLGRGGQADRRRQHDARMRHDVAGRVERDAPYGANLPILGTWVATILFGRALGQNRGRPQASETDDENEREEWETQCSHGPVLRRLTRRSPCVPPGRRAHRVKGRAGRPGFLTRGSPRRCCLPMPREATLQGCRLGTVAGSLREAAHQACQSIDPVRRSLPAYSGVTVWAFHPLRLVAGEASVRAEV